MKPQIPWVQLCALVTGMLNQPVFFVNFIASKNWSCLLLLPATLVILPLLLQPTLRHRLKKVLREARAWADSWTPQRGALVGFYGGCN